MMTHRVFISAFVGACALAPALGAQRTPVALRGIVFDSLRGRPLRGAFITVGGAQQTITTDSHGRFELSGVQPGLHVITAQHALLDSIGLSGLTTKANVTADGREVELAVPSFETLWNLTCEGRAPRDSGLVFGTIRRATGGKPVADALVELSWWDLVLDKNRRVVERRWRLQTHTNKHGGYAVCGVAHDVEFSIQASLDSSSSGLVSLPVGDVRVQRRDLLIGRSDDTLRRGIVSGMVTDPDGHGIGGARISTSGAEEVRSDDDGQFVLSHVPLGTRRIEARFIGTAPIIASADVTPRDTAFLNITLPKAVALAAMKTYATYGVRVMAAEFNERRKRGFAYSRDSLDIVRYDQFVNALRDIPGMNVQYKSSNLSVTVSDGKGGSCTPAVRIDGAPAEFGHLVDLFPNEVGGLEVYTRGDHIPERFVPVGIQPQCGMILVWTKYGFRNR